MIVTCERCEQRYRIREEKLPPQGGKIRCPTCRHVFVVRPDGLPVPPGGELDAMSPDDMPSTDLADDGGDAAPPATAKEPDTRAWKLRVSGLTYAFQTLESLQSWLLARDSLENIKVAREGDEWRELGDYPEVLTAQLTSRFFPMGNVPRAGSRAAERGGVAPLPKPDISSPLLGGDAKDGSAVRRPRTPAASTAPQRNKPQPRRRSPRPQPDSQPILSSRAKGLLATVIFLVGALFVLQALGWIDLRSLVPGLQAPTSESTELRPPASAQTPSVKNGEPPTPELGEDGLPLPQVVLVDGPLDETPPEEVVPDGPTEEEIYLATLTKVGTLIEERRWAEARAYLEPLAAKRPDDLEVNKAMLKVFRGLGLEEEQTRLKKKVAELEKAQKTAP